MERDIVLQNPLQACFSSIGYLFTKQLAQNLNLRINLQPNIKFR